MKPYAYYNEFDPYAAQWLRNLISKGLIAPGEVDERSIVEVQPDDLNGFTQCHFFAGIGGWSLALQMAKWPIDREVWTGSPPCQPFSVAGNQKGEDDDRHLWPAFFELIKVRKPSVIFGEQVAAAIRFGWIDGVFTDLESEGYSTGAAIVPACAVNAPHKRDRLWFVADTNDTRSQRGLSWRENSQREVVNGYSGRNCPNGNFWRSGIQTECPDEKARRVEPSIPLLVDGIFSRVGRLRAYGNAIVPQVAAEIIKAYMKARP